MSPDSLTTALENLERFSEDRKPARAASKKFTRRKKYYPFFKRGIDIVVALVALLMCCPIFMICAVLIKLTDGGSIFYISKRVGIRGKHFAFPKFRSMYVDAEKRRENLENTNQHGEGAITFKMKKDPRVTPFGRWMRRFSIDELPQLFCVLTGSMTLVGPRPAIQSEVDQYSLADRHRLDVKQGITCIWQISGRAEIPFPVQMKMDLEYVRHQSLWLDLSILSKTIPAVLSGKGAY